MKSSRPKWFLEPLAIKLAVGVTLLVVVTLVPALWLAARHHYRVSLDLKRTEVHFQGKLIRLALEHQMLENDRGLIHKMVEGYSRDPALKRIVILDRKGRVRYTNDRAYRGRTLSRHSPTCKVCHTRSPAERVKTSVIAMQKGRVLRSVHPIRNAKACHRCHDADHAINGVLIIDTDITDLRRQLRTDTRLMAAVVGVIAAVLLVGLGIIIRRLVLTRLRRLEATARAIGSGRLSERVETKGNDAVSRLGREFNSMADSLSDLLERLREQRSQLEDVMNSVDDGILLIDKTSTIVGLNKALAERLGTVTDDLLYRRCWEIWPEGSACRKCQMPGTTCPARRCFKTGELLKNFVTWYTKDGEQRDEEVFTSPVLSDDGTVVQVVEVWRDITGRKSEEARMAEMQRMASLGMLASGFSHEVNTPLGTMLFCADDLKKRFDADPELAEQAGLVVMIRDEILRCRKITQQFLQLSRGQSLSTDVVDLPSMVRDTLPLVAHAAKEARVALKVVENGDTPVVTANAGAVQQVLLNLLLNAVQASKANGVIRIGWTGGVHPSITVDDDGRGMDAETRKKIFEPFFTGNESGTGLGLFVSINLARQWGGNISVQSEPEKGSQFTIEFPTEESP